MKSLLIVADSHTNSTVGLAKPATQLDDGDNVSAGIVRRWLFHTFEDILIQVSAKVKQYHSELYGLLNGDILETDYKERSTQVISKNPADVQKMGQDVFEPLFDMCKGVYVLRGTEAHAGISSNAEEIFAKNFTNTIQDESGNYSRYWLQLEMDGVRMDVCHHPRGGGGGRPMNSQGGIDRIASDALFQYANDGLTPPHLVIRSHLHGYRDSRDAFRVRAIITPPMSLLTAYTHRIGINVANPVGAILITCDKGRYFVEPLLREVRRTSWEIL